MTQKRKIEAGDFFYRFYKKRTSSFYANLYKAGITASDEDIHKARVDLKKVFALFSFFEILGPGNFNKKKYSFLFKNIFNKAGKMRENQVNIQYVEKYQHDYPGVLLFMKYLKSEQKKSAKGFIAAIVQFDEKKLKKISKSIKKVCHEMKSDTIIERSKDYLWEKARKIESVRHKTGDIESVHTIRKELKKTGAILSLLHQVKPGEDLEKLLDHVNKTEALIGEWHDRVVLIDTLKKFFKSFLNHDEVTMTQLMELNGIVGKEAEQKLEALLPFVDEVVRLTEQRFTRFPTI